MSRAPAAGLRREPGAAAREAFAQRLRKNRRHWGRWAARRGYGAWRVYDRDVPEFPVAIDVYEPVDAVVGTRACVQEIDTGWHQDEAAHAAWTAWVRDAVHDALDIPEAHVVLKQRRRRRGRAQHERTGLAGEFFMVAEAGLALWVNLEAYLDTGLFPDHRALRALVRERARGARMLNLFAYTGAFTVYAAAGGAAASDTVDLSNTYLAWAARNFALNGMDAERHRLIRADALAWLDDARTRGARYDLIVLDPPAFSTSKAMTTTLDVQRDHRALIERTRALLAGGGELYFSTNLRTFRLDPALRDAEDLTHATRAEDFRDPHVHHAFRFTGPGSTR